MVRRSLLPLLTLCALWVLPAASAQATLHLLQPDASTPATFRGHGGYSSDGLGQIGAGNSVQAEIPAGSHVEGAWLYGTYNVSAPSQAQRTINVEGTDFVLQHISAIGSLATARAEVTQKVRNKVGSGGAVFSFQILSDPVGLDGVALVVTFSNPALPVTTVAVLDGSSNFAGDEVTFNFAEPVDPTQPDFAATMAVGSGFSFQGGSGPGTHTCGPSRQQFSRIKVNDSLLTECAGNYDDGEGTNDALITVGGVGDSIDNPTPPLTPPTDDELYDVKPFLAKGDTQLVVDTANPSNDDNLFLAVVATSAQARVTTEVCDNGTDDDGDGKVDGDDPDCQPDLAVTKNDSPDPVPAGGGLTYTVTARNNGPTDAHGVTVTDTLPDGVTFRSASSTQGGCTESSGTVTCTIGTLASGESATVTIRVTAPGAAGTITNVATVDGDEGDPDASNDRAGEETTVTGSAAAVDLTVIKTDSPDPVVVGTPLTYSILVKNRGPASATGVTMTDTLAASLTFISASATQGSCTQASRTVTCDLGTLPAGARATVTIKVRPNAAGRISNTARVKANEPDSNPRYNADTEKTTVQPRRPASLVLSPKTATNPLDAEHCVTATVRDQVGDPMGGVVVRFSTSGSTSASGSATTDSSGHARFCYFGPAFPGADTITAFADTDGSGARNGDEPADSAGKSWVRPAESGCRIKGEDIRIRAANGDFVTAKLKIKDGDKAKDHVRYEDEGPAGDLDVDGNKLAAYVVCSADLTRATIFVRVPRDKNGPPVDVRIDVVDGGRKGRGDTFRIRTPDGYDSGVQPLLKGDIDIRHASH